MDIDIPKQVEYWRSGALDSLEAAEILIDKDKRLEGLFFCHLAIEKALKAHAVKGTRDVPPRTHNLQRLVSVARLDLKDSQFDFMGNMMEFQIEGRYPDMVSKPPDKRACQRYLKKTKDMVEWLNGLL